MRVATLHGAKEIKIPKNTPDKHSIIIQDHGYNSRYGGFGPFKVFLRHEMPKDLPKDVLEVLKKINPGEENYPLYNQILRYCDGK